MQVSSGGVVGYVVSERFCCHRDAQGILEEQRGPERLFLFAKASLGLLVAGKKSGLL